MNANIVQCPECVWTGNEPDFEIDGNERKCPVCQYTMRRVWSVFTSPPTSIPEGEESYRKTPACKNCDSFVTEASVRVFAPDEAKTVRVCPNRETRYVTVLTCGVQERLGEGSVTEGAVWTERIERRVMNNPKTLTLSESDEEWTIEDFTRRVSWTDETAECTNCRSAFELDTTHYYATLRPCRSTSPIAVSRELVFCSHSCADEWLHS